jgi:hypothetical protein
MLARTLKAIEAALGWLFAYPLIPLQIVLFWLVSWGRLGAGLGADDLFWSEFAREQFFNGLTCGFLFAELLLVRYLLDPDREQFRFWFSLLPVTDPAVNRLGQYLALFWVPALLVLGGFKLLAPQVRNGTLQVWPFFLGTAVSVVLTCALIAAASSFGLLTRLARAEPTGETAAGTEPARQRASSALRGLAALAALLYLIGLVIIYLRHFAGAEMSPVTVVCVLLGVVNAVYGFVAFRLPGFQYVLLVLLVGLGIVANSPFVNPNSQYSLTFPGLEDYYAAPQRLDEGPKDPNGERPDHYYNLLRSQAEGKSPKPTLIPSDAPLGAMRARWQEQRKDGTKPRIVIVCTSGGGIRAAVWTGVVLEGLERELPAHFRNHIRMFTGASGGMVGATLYVADFENGPVGPQPIDPETALGGLSGPLARDSLRRTTQTMLLTDLPTLWWPGRVSWDRGRELERRWEERTVGANGLSPFQKTFEQLTQNDMESKGLRPSLVYSPMLVEDCRRLLISNLDLEDLTWTSGQMPGLKSFRDKYKIPEGPNEPLLSLSAVELFRLFPEAREKFRVVTAARMNASFPIVSPAVSLPTSPPRRVVDAGYYDNFGVDVAAMWLYRHEKAIREHTSGVVVIEIRAFRNDHARWHFTDTEAEKLTQNRGGLQTALETLSTPVEAIGNARTRAAYYRNDELLDGLNRHFNQKSPEFFRSVSFECEVDAALSWTLPRDEARSIARSFYEDPTAPQRKMRGFIQTRIDGLKEWFGTGGR